MFGTIVVAVDGSGAAGRAVETAAEIAAGTKDKVVVFHGVVVYHSWGKDVPAEAADETQQLVDRYVAQLAAAGVSPPARSSGTWGRGSAARCWTWPGATRPG
jgi:nucleotide-binding universal stress UspA family protein